MRPGSPRRHGSRRRRARHARRAAHTCFPAQAPVAEVTARLANPAPMAHISAKVMVSYVKACLVPAVTLGESRRVLPVALRLYTGLAFRSLAVHVHHRKMLLRVSMRCIGLAS